MIVGTTPWEKWPERHKRKLEEAALGVPCDWCRVAIAQPCGEGSGHITSMRPFVGAVSVHGRTVCYMRILRAWFNVPDEERQSTALFVALYAAP